MYKLRIEAFRFMGGDRSELDVERSLPGGTDWNAIVGKLASSCPSVFPTHPHDIPNGVRNMAFINLPIPGMPGCRAHCVYFSHAITRTFWNVLCFAYHETECRLHTLAAVSADNWYSIGTRLSNDTEELPLPTAESEGIFPALPFYESSQSVFYRFPTARGQVITCAKDDWKSQLEEAKKISESTFRLQHPQQPPPPRRRVNWNKIAPRRILPPLALLALCILMAHIVLYTMYPRKQQPTPTLQPPMPPWEEPLDTEQQPQPPMPAPEKNPPSEIDDGLVSQISKKLTNIKNLNIKALNTLKLHDNSKTDTISDALPEDKADDCPDLKSSGKRLSAENEANAKDQAN